MNYSEHEMWRQREERRNGIIIPRPTPYHFRVRERKLKRAGFLPWERRWLVSHKTNTPAMKALIKERRNMFRTAKRQRETWEGYAKRISDWYRRQGWVFKDGRLNPFKMFDAFKRRHDQPDTPQPKKKRIKKDYYSTKRRTES